MQLFTTIASLTVAASCISAMPTEQLPKREIGGILICQGANATGPCIHEVYSIQECHDLPADLQRNASTFAPDGDGFYCYPRAGNCSEICTSPTGCTFGAVNFHDPRKWDLAAIHWERLIGSFDCHLNSTTTSDNDAA